MSYEGYTEFLCEDGHYYTCDAYYEYACPICSKQIIWANGVDQTNDEGFPYTRDRLKIKTEQKSQTCSECGIVKVTEQATYFVPTEGEMEEYRKDYNDFYRNLGHYIAEEDGEY